HRHHARSATLIAPIVRAAGLIDYRGGQLVQRVGRQWRRRGSGAGSYCHGSEQGSQQSFHLKSLAQRKPRLAVASAPCSADSIATCMSTAKLFGSFIASAPAPQNLPWSLSPVSRLSSDTSSAE